MLEIYFKLNGFIVQFMSTAFAFYESNSNVTLVDVYGSWLKVEEVSTSRETEYIKLIQLFSF